MEYVYGALLLHKLGKPVDDDGLKKVVSAAGAEVDEAKVKTLVASLQGVNIEEELANANVVAASVVAAGGAGGAEGGDDKAEEKKEEKAEAAAEGLSSLFG